MTKRFLDQATLDQTTPVIKSQTNQLSVELVFGILLLSVIFAVFFRFYKLDQIPPGINGDELEHALDAIDVLHGKFTFTSPRIPHMPMTYNYLLALAFQTFGISTLTQRALTATFGVFLIPINFFAIRLLFKKEKEQKVPWIALFSSLLLSTSLWSIFVSRIGFEYILTPIFALIAIFFFWCGYEGKGKWWTLSLSGLFATVGFYIYSGAASFLLVIPGSIFMYVLLHRKLPHNIKLKELSFFVIIVFLLVMPLFLTLTSSSDQKTRRIARKFVFNQASGPVEGVIMTGISIVAHAETFLAIKGEHQWHANLSGKPILGPVLAVCFVVGILISFKRVKKMPYLFLLVYWTAMVMPAVLSFKNSPGHFRMAGALPPTYAFIAIAWTEIYLKLTSFLKGPAVAALLPFLFIGLIWQPAQSYYNYFVVWANQPELREEEWFGRPPFLLMERMESETNPEAIFVFARNAASPEQNDIVDSFYRGTVPLAYIRVDEPTIRQELNEKIGGHRIVHLITQLRSVYEARWNNADPSGYLPFTLARYGTLIDTEYTTAYTILTYELEQMDFAEFEPVSIVLANEMELNGFDVQHIGNTLFVDLVWQLWPNVSHYYTTSVKLVDQNGQFIAGQDVLPDQATLTPDETMITYYALSLPGEGVPPGSYSLEVSLYYFTNNQIVTVDSVILDQPVIVQ